MILAAVVLAQAIALDPQSGVWFPPDGWRDQYVERRRSYSQDVRQAFERDPKLMVAVCTAVAAAPKPGQSVDATLRQMRMMLDMTCVAAMARERERPARESREATVDAALTKRLEAATTAAAATAEPDRKGAQRSTLAEIDSLVPGDARLDAIFRAIVLRPQDARGAWHLLLAARDTSETKTPLNSRELAEFVERLYRTRAAAIGRDALAWQNGLPEVLLYLGKDEEARRLQADQVAAAGSDASDYDRMMLAVMEEIGGRTGSVSATFANCREVQACRDTVWSLATRTAEVRAAVPPKVLGDLLEMTLPWYAGNWPVRLYTTKLVARFSPSRARSEVTAMYVAPDAPQAAILDLLRIDGALAVQEKDHLRTLALQDCWLILRNVKLPPFSPEQWTRLAALPEPKPGEIVAEPCFAAAESSDDDLTFSTCTSFALVERFQTAVSSREWGFARQSVEKIVAHTLAGKLSPSQPRRALAALAAGLMRDGHAAEAARIVRYLETQPHDAVVRLTLDDFRGELPRTDEVVLEPWRESGAGALPQICGN